MTMDEGEHRFWSLAHPLLGREGITRSRMMGLPCLRVDGAFFASCDRSTSRTSMSSSITKTTGLALWACCVMTALILSLA